MFSRGADSLKISMEMHVLNRQRLTLPAGIDCLVVKGGSELPMYDSDTNHDFRQESYFQWLFGVKEPGCLGIISQTCTLLVPRFHKSHEAWLGPIEPLDWFKAQYLVDHVAYVDELPTLLEGKRCAVIRNVNADSGLAVDTPEVPNLEEEASKQIACILDELRAIKTPAEIEVLTFVNDVSSRAHIQVMQHIFRGTYGSVQSMEHFAESAFKFGCALQGCARVGYNCIACSGERNAILHYGHPAEPNNSPAHPQGLRLLDMGAEYHCYTADVTATFPTSGKFSVNQKAVYQCVWETVKAVETELRPGVSYRDMHRFAQRRLLEELMRRTDLILSEDFESMVRNNLIARLFMPHGLGHMLGLNVHDVGGYEVSDPRDRTDISLTGLRLGRRLKPGMVLTVEPGIYFIDYLMQEAKSDENLSTYVDWELWEEFKQSVGGVRIEDNVLITDQGCKVLTDLPRTPDEVESVIQGLGTWEVGHQRRQY